MAEMYVIKSGELYELRQERFRAGFEAGKEHPHDVCAVARSVQEMHEMTDKYFAGIDYSRVEAPGSPAGDGLSK